MLEVRNDLPVAFPFASSFELFQINFLGFFGKARNNKLMHLWLRISPPSRCKDTNKFWKQQIFSQEICEKSGNHGKQWKNHRAGCWFQRLSTLESNCPLCVMLTFTELTHWKKNMPCWVSRHNSSVRKEKPTDDKPRTIKFTWVTIRTTIHFILLIDRCLSVVLWLWNVLLWHYYVATTF